MSDAIEAFKEISRQYSAACENAQARFAAWEKRRPRILERLSTIAEALVSDEGYFKGHLLVSEAPVFSMKDEKRYQARKLMSVLLKSDNRTVLRFHTEKGGDKPLKLTELGFEVHFSAQLNGAIQVFCMPPFMPHQSQSKSRPRQIIEVFAHPNDIDDAAVDEGGAQSHGTVSKNELSVSSGAHDGRCAQRDWLPAGRRQRDAGRFGIGAASGRRGQCNKRSTCRFTRPAVGLVNGMK